MKLIFRLLAQLGFFSHYPAGTRSLKFFIDPLLCLLIFPFIFRFVLSIHGDSRFTKTSAQTVMDHSIRLIHNLHQPILEKIEQVSNGYSDLQSLRELVTKNMDAMKPLATLHKRIKLFNHNGMVSPTSVTVSHRIEAVSSEQRSIPVTYQYIPLLETLSSILSNEKIADMVDHPQLNMNNVMTSFLDSPRSKSLKALGLDIQLALYVDDIEIANPLGAKSGVHKLSMFYFMLLNLPGSYIGHTSHIHLVAAANAQDIRCLGIDIFLGRLISDVKKLEDGVIINGKLRRGTVAIICADNLAANQLYGMTESFSAEHYCRFCVCSKTECQRSCAIVSVDRLRTMQVIILFYRIT